MKTKVEIEGYEIEIIFNDGVISVKAEKDEEIVEEFTIDVEGQGSQEDGDDDEIQGFGEFSEEEDFEGQGEDDDFEGQGEDDDDDDDDDDFEGQDDEDAPALESFQSFTNRKK